jgi:signal transduction histidine kinase
VNEAYCCLTGYSRDELLTLAWKDLETNPNWLSVKKHILAGSQHFESYHRKKDGSRVEVEVSISCLPEQNVLFAFLRNISERKQHETEILHLNASLQKRVQENETLYQTERSHRELAEILVEASQVVTATLNIDVVLDRIMEQVGRIVKNDVCNIVLLTGEKPRVVRTRGYEQFDASTFIETFVFPLEGVPIRQHIVETREPVVVPDVRAEQRWQLYEEKVWLRSYVAAPICVQSRVIGLLNIGISMPNFYNESHGHTLMAFANHAAVAFQNAQLFEDMQSAAKRLEMLSRRLLDIQETERRYIARELHDEIGQTLTAARLNLQALGRLKSGDAFEHKLNEGLQILKLALNQVRNMSVDLHPSVLDDLGLVPALRWYADREARWGDFEVRVQAEDFGPRLDNHLELVCFRVVQEALTNAMRHAQATRVDVELSRVGEDLVLYIQDNGRGFDVSKALARAEKGHSLGLLGMRERVSLANGRFEIQSEINAGTRICATLPFREAINTEEQPL